MDKREAITDVAELHRRLEPCRLCVAGGIRVESMPVFRRLRRANAVSSSGRRAARREAVDGRPFIGPAGHRLRRVARAGRPRDREAFYSPLLHRGGRKSFAGKAAERRRRAALGGDGAHVPAVALA